MCIQNFAGSALVQNLGWGQAAECPARVSHAVDSNNSLVVEKDVLRLRCSPFCPNGVC